MDKLSPHYRTDDCAGPDPTVRGVLDTEFFERLPYVHEPNPKILVVFSAGTGCGKTTIAQRLTKEFHGLLLENDAIKRTIIANYPEYKDKDAINPLTWKYSIDLYSRLSTLTRNGLVIRDGIIDWYSDRILPIFQQQGYRTFVIELRLSRQKMKQLIVGRGDTPTAKADRLLMLIDDQVINQKRFRSQHVADVVLDDTTIFNTQIVVDAFRKVWTEESKKL